MHMAMHAFVHERTSACFHNAFKMVSSVFFFMSVFLRRQQTGKHARTHGCLRMHTRFHVCMHKYLIACL